MSPCRADRVKQQLIARRHYEKSIKQSSVEQLEYTQENIGRCFKDGRTLQELIHDLDAGRVDPLEHPNMQLEVVRKWGNQREVFYSNDNRRLYCLKQHQAHNPDQWERADVKLYEWSPAFDRLIQRLPQRKDLPKDYVRVRR